MIKSISALIVILLSAGFAFFEVKPLYTLTETHRQDLQVINDTFTDVGKINELIQRTTQTLGSVDTTTLSRFNVFLPESVDSIRFANNIKYIGAKNNLVLMNIKVDEKATNLKTGEVAPEKQGVLESTFSLNRTTGLSDKTPRGATSVPEKKFATTKASFTVTATYPGFLLLLDDLEQSLGLLNVTSLSFREHAIAETTKTIASKTPVPVLYNYAVELETYSLK